MIDYGARAFIPDEVRREMVHLRGMLVAGISTIALTLILILLSNFLVIADFTFIMMAVIMGSSLSAAVVRIIGNRSIFEHVPEVNDQYRIQKHSEKFRELVMVYCFLVVAQIVTTLLSMFQIVLSTKTATGIFSSFYSMNTSGRAIFIVMIIDLTFGVVSGLVILKQTWNMLDRYRCQIGRFVGPSTQGVVTTSSATPTTSAILSMDGSRSPQPLLSIVSQ